MIRRFLPSLLLVIAGWVCVTACVGCLAAATAVWLSAYWGLTGALLAVSGFAALLAVIAFALVYFRMRRATSHGQPIEAAAMSIWKSHPVALSGGVLLFAFLLARKPVFLTRILVSGARSAAALMALRRML